jgi:hypothetical protein
VTARILRIEARRSTALWAGALIATSGAFLLYATSPPYGWWMELVVAQRQLLAVLWPLALGAGAWQARRERRHRTEELLAATPRPRWQRAAPVAAAMAGALVVAYAAMLAAGLGHTGNLAGYVPAAAPAVVAIGALSLVAAAWLGLAAGRLLPSPLTPPLLAVAGFAVLELLPPLFIVDYDRVPRAELLLPGLKPRTATLEFVTLAGRAALAQAIWLAALAVTGLVAFAAARRAVRLAAVVPAVGGAAVALALLPGSLSADAFVADRGALAQVCTPDAPRVCVTRAHAAALDDLRGPARQALAILAAKLPDPPTSVVEDPGYPDPGPRAQRADTVLVGLLGMFPHANAPEQTGVGAAFDSQGMLWQLLDGAGTRSCRAAPLSPPTPGELEALAQGEPDRDGAARQVAAAWLLGRPLAPATEPGADPAARATATLAVETLAALRRLPAGEQRARVAALRRAELACGGRDLVDILVGPGGRR